VDSLRGNVAISVINLLVLLQTLAVESGITGDVIAGAGVVVVVVIVADNLVCVEVSGNALVISSVNRMLSSIASVLDVLIVLSINLVVDLTMLVSVLVSVLKITVFVVEIVDGGSVAFEEDVVSVIETDRVVIVVSGLNGAVTL
jgi:hypothetical protein